MLIVGIIGSYEVGKKIATDALSSWYLCRDAADTELLLRITTDVEHNGAMEREAFVLRFLMAQSDAYKQKYESDPEFEDMQPFDWLFSNLVETFACDEQGGRQINVFKIKDLKDIGALVPIASIRKKKLTVDLKTSVWMVGKLLKLLGFVHENGVIAGEIKPGKVLIDRDSHRVILIDWTNAVLCDGKMSREKTRNNISEAAQAVLKGALSCDDVTNCTTSDEAEQEYTDIVKSIAIGGFSDAGKAHVKLYDIVKKLWGISYHPFTTINTGGV